MQLLRILFSLCKLFYYSLFIISNMINRQWISKPNDEIIAKMDETISLRLYLVQENGPLSFTFHDEQRNKITTTIGENNKCSCSKVTNNHCLHTLYVLNRIFKIPFHNPLIFQCSLTDMEIGRIINSRHKVEKANAVRNKDFNEVLNDTGKKRSLSENNTCSVCQEDMYTQEGLICCKSVCGNHFHNKCIQIWADHKLSTGKSISCPMCRENWNDYTKDDSNKSNQNRVKSHNGVICSHCPRRNLKYERFHCLNCENMDICTECFNIGKHNTNHSFLVKKSPDEKWLGLSISRTSHESQNIRHTILNIKISQYLSSLLEDNESQSIRNNNNGADQQLSEKTLTSCAICKSNKTSNLHLLRLKVIGTCMHCVHVKCCEMLFRITDKGAVLDNDMNFNVCPECKNLIFPGLASIQYKMQSHSKKVESLEDKSIIKYKLNKDLKDKSRRFLQIPSKTTMYNNNSVFPKNRVSDYSDLGFMLNIQQVKFDTNNIKGFEERLKPRSTKMVSKIMPNPPKSTNPNCRVRDYNSNKLILHPIITHKKK